LTGSPTSNKSEKNMKILKRAALVVLISLVPGCVLAACSDSDSGTWVQDQFNGQPSPENNLHFVIDSVVTGNCLFLGSFNGAGFVHELSGTIGGSLTVRRTDPKGCFTIMRGTIAIANADGRRRLVYRLSSSDGGCEVPRDITEERTFYQH
jgi:hypothetical protein